MNPYKNNEGKSEPASGWGGDTAGGEEPDPSV